MTDIKLLQEEFGRLHKDNSDLINFVASQKRTMTASETKVKEERYARMDEIKSIVENAKREAGRAFDPANLDRYSPKGLNNRFAASAPQTPRLLNKGETFSAFMG